MKYRSISEEHVSSCLKGHSKFLVLMSTDEWSDKTDDCNVTALALDEALAAKQEG